MNKEDNKATILVVDDTTENIDVLNGILSGMYKIKVALNGEKALKIATSKEPPDLILLDIMMPGIDGYEVCRRLKKNGSTKNIPVIFVTAKGEVDDETKGFELGAVDYITKPVSPPIVLARVKTQLELKLSQNRIEQLLSKTLLGSIKLMTDILALINPQAFSQASRLKRLAHDLAVNLELKDIWRYEIAALLSQIGCVTIPKDILGKVAEGKNLSPREREMYSSQSLVGHDLLSNIPRLETIAEMIVNQNVTMGLHTAQSDITEWGPDVLGGQMLKIIYDYDKITSSGKTPSDAIVEMSNRGGIYPPALMDALMEIQVISKEKTAETKVNINDLKSGMILTDNIVTDDGTIIIGKDNEVTAMVLNLLTRYSKHRKIKEPISVRMLKT
ncbi:response regulator [Candidatus Latescibacterota bacterium]